MDDNPEKYRLTKEVLDSVRDIDGFPIGEDEDIIALSNPPYYTAYPNPYVEEFIKKHGNQYDPENDNYHREPFSSDISEGKNDPIYSAHSYHTKVPHKAVMRYIIHYTNPNDIIFDGFCGTGMAGVAAQLCGFPDSEFKKKIEEELPYVKWGIRKTILNDLCPIATFIAYNYNNPVDFNKYRREAFQILDEVNKECGWMYKTNHVIDGRIQYKKDLNGVMKPVIGNINYTVFSDVFICPECTNEIIYYEAIKKSKKGKREFKCYSCNANLSKRDVEKALITIFDNVLNESIQISKQVPVLINYSVYDNGKKRKVYEKEPDSDDLERIKKIQHSKIPYWYPKIKFMQVGEKWGDTWRAGVHAGITHLHHFFHKDALITLSTIFQKINEKNSTIKRYLLFTFQQAILGMSKLNRYAPSHFSQANRFLSGTLYISSQTSNVSPSYILEGKIKRLCKLLKSIKEMDKKNVIISTQSATNLKNIPSNSVDYIFTDPPFGNNLMYSELNFLWEAWNNVITNIKHEAIINYSQKKSLNEYQTLMEKCFKEYYRILKPGRWMTVEFHNSRNSVWISIQEALMRAGFVVADVRTLDKQQGTFKQITSTSAVKQDLIISVYKPNEELERSLVLIAGTEEGVWAFVRQHIRHLPIYVEEKGIAQVINERQNYLLYDRMVAFHVQRGISVPISASEFYAGLKERVPQRDGMYFLIDQVAEYDRKRMKAQKIEQTYLTVHDEKSAIHWLRRELEDHPQTYQEIQPKFLQNLFKAKHEDLPELRDILEQNFIQDKEERWYVPDPSKDKDLEKLRLRSLLSEFRDYLITKGKLRIFRSEAIRAGFNECWQQGDYESIIKVAEKLPTEVLQEEPTLLMYYDNALMRTQD